MPTATLHVLRGSKIDCVKLSSRYLYSAEEGESKRLVEPPYSYSESKKIPFFFILKSSFEKQLFKLSELSPIRYMKGLWGSSCVRALTQFCSVASGLSSLQDGVAPKGEKKEETCSPSHCLFRLTSPCWWLQ